MNRAVPVGVPPGFLLVVEGLDGSGKSTLMRELESECRAAGRVCCCSREPTQGEWGLKLRESARQGRLSLEEELDLFVRDRAEHVRALITPALSRGEVVILDRYYFSNAAYQGARGADPAGILERNEAFAPQPDLVLLLDCDPDCSLRRIQSRGNQPDAFEKRESLARVRQIYLSIQRPYIHVLDASQPADAVVSQAVGLFRHALQKQRETAI